MAVPCVVFGSWNEPARNRPPWTLFFQAMGTCCSKDDADKLEAVESKAHERDRGGFLVAGSRRALDGKMNPWKHCVCVCLSFGRRL